MALPGDPAGLFGLDGCGAVVAGASSGIGARVAEVLAGAGASVVLGARREERVADLSAQIENSGGKSVPVHCDVTEEDDVTRLVETAERRFGRLDVMVVCAGIAPDEDQDPESPESFRRVLEVNTTGAYICARAAAGPMRRAGRGSIVLVSSISGLVAGDGPDTPSYTASKGALVNLVRELAVRWAPEGVRVNAIAPGWFPTEMTAETLASPEGNDFVSSRTPLGRPGRIEELDGAVLFLASAASSYVTGHTLVVDGGWIAR